MIRSWRKIAFLTSALSMVVGICASFYVCYDLSAGLEQKFKTKFLKQDGWFMGREYRDNISQYEEIRAAFPVLAILTIVQLLLSHLSMFLVSVCTRTRNVRLLRDTRLMMNGCFALLCFLALHGSNLVWIIVINIVQYGMIKLLGKRKRLAMAYVWASVIALFYFLCTDERSIDLYRVVYRLLERLKWDKESMFMMWLKYCERNQGVMRSWSNIYRLSFLRIVSFQMDYLWYIHELQDSSIESSFYSFSNYLGFVNYLPLYLAGPLATFNSFVSGWTLKEVPDYMQLLSLEYVSKAIRSDWWKNYLKNLTYWMCFALVFDISSHFIYIWKVYYSYDWNTLSSVQLTCMTYVLSYWDFWGKYFIILQMGKMWAMADFVHGECAAPLDHVEIPDDLPMSTLRCNSALRINLDTWHTSFIYFAIRYLYVPLGGMKRLYLSVPVVFMFSAWVHGISLLWTQRAAITQALPLVIEWILRYLYYNQWQQGSQTVKQFLAFFALVLFDVSAVTAYGWPAEIPARHIFYMIFFRNKEGILSLLLVLLFFSAKVYYIFVIEAPVDEVMKQPRSDILYFQLEDRSNSPVDVISAEDTTEEQMIAAKHKKPTEWNIYQRALTLDQVEQYQSTYHPLLL